MTERIEIAKKWSEEQIEKDDVLAVFLFGSVARGDTHEESDIDLVSVVDEESTIELEEGEKEGVKIENWRHSISWYEKLFQKDWNEEEMFTYSLFLNILKECEVMYDETGRFEDYRDKAENWGWPERCIQFIQTKVEESLQLLRGDSEEIPTKFQKLGFHRKFFILIFCKKLLDLGKPVSIRYKDYYLYLKRYDLDWPSLEDFQDLFRPISHDRLDKLTERTFRLFNETVDRDPWTELEDAKKHLKKGNDLLSTISLLNGVYPLGGHGLKEKGVERKHAQRGEFIYPSSEIELIRKSKEHWNEFYRLYRDINDPDRWSEEEIEEVEKELMERV